MTPLCSTGFIEHNENYDTSNPKGSYYSSYGADSPYMKNAGMQASHMASSAVDAPVNALGVIIHPELATKMFTKLWFQDHSLTHKMEAILGKLLSQTFILDHVSDTPGNSFLLYACKL